MEFFTHTQLTNNITRIKDICGTYLYLIEGKEKACLLDTGDGFGSLKEYVSKLTNKEIIVILTHGHLDHVGGAAEFENIYMSKKDIPVYNIHSKKEYRITRGSKLIEELNIQKKDIQDDISADSFYDLVDGQTFDLGDLHLKMIAVPGHTPGMFCVLIEEERYCLFGDACGVFVLLFDDMSSTVSEYLNSLKHLKTYEHQYDYIIRNHGTGESPKELLDNVIACCNDVLLQKDEHIPIEFMGRKLFLAKQRDENGNRIDGKEGNLAYRFDKAI